MIKQENRNSVESSKIWNLEQNKLDIIDLAGDSTNPVFDYSLVNKVPNGYSFVARFTDNTTAEIRILDGEFKKTNLT